MLLCFTSCANPDLKGVKKSDVPTNYIHMNVKGYGDILIELYPDIAPDTVNNFKKLVSEKFYNGLTFHRIDEEFMIQGGDPNGNGTGGSPDKIKGEFAANGFPNNLSHTRGVISMARANEMNSASSQFFIVCQDSTFLDGNYAGFGKVIYGLDTVDKIANAEKTANPKTYEMTYPKKKIVINYVNFVTVDGTVFAG